MSSAQQPTIREMTQADIPNVQAFIKQTFGTEGYYPIASHIPMVIAEHDKTRKNHQASEREGGKGFKIESRQPF